MQLKVGQALVSAVDDTSVIVTRAPSGDVSVTCGGADMFPKGESGPSAEAAADQQDGTLLGKRYVDDAGTIELLVTKPGQGTLALDGVALATAEAKALPSSD
ncbi:MAG: hypothetical protein JWP31_659 [Aeromicrobium sp.]|nr:hypothetical protein [Aeromicrobium sp.]